jgi:hypothetical protein
MTQSQKQFEAWAVSKGQSIDKFKAGYVQDRSHLSWEAWQASREEQVVELPDFFVFGIDAAVYRDDVIAALDAAGVKYK